MNGSSEVVEVPIRHQIDVARFYCWQLPIPQSVLTYWPTLSFIDMLLCYSCRCMQYSLSICETVQAIWIRWFVMRAMVWVATLAWISVGVFKAWWHLVAQVWARSQLTTY